MAVAVAVVLIWGETFISTKILISNGLRPADIFVFRFVLAYALIWIISPKRLWCRSLKDELTMLLLGISGGSLYFLTENTALKYSTASNVGILVCSAPMLTALVLSAFYKDERISMRQVAGSLVAFVGMALVVLNGELVLHLNPLGDALAVGAALTWAFYSLFMKSVSGKYSMRFITRKVFAYGLLSIIPYFILVHPLNLDPGILGRPAVWGNLVYLGVVASLTCFVLWNWCLKQLGTVRTTNLIYCQPFFTMLIAAVWLGERITWMAVLGTAVLIAGMMLMVGRKRRRRAAVVAMDSFKGSLTSAEANEAVRDALKECGFDDVRCFTMSDGGEGFCAAVSQYVEAEEVTAKVHGPLGSLVDARYLVADGVAYIESASVSGYGQISDGDRNPFMLSSRGLGELLLDASGRGVKKIVVGLGGTCTLDAGIGMLQALGARLVGGERLLDPITSADFSGMAPLCPVEVWYDTAAPMCGENGPVMLFGRQKGLEEGQMPAAEAWMGHVSQLYSKVQGVDTASLPGAGAAGGIGGAFAAVLGADMFPGGGKVIELSGMRQFIIESGDALEAVVTGEGHFDAQTLTGKLPAVVAITARDAAAHKPLVICAAGIADDLQQDLFDKVLSISEGAGQLQESMRKPAAMKNLKASVKLAMR